MITIKSTYDDKIMETTEEGERAPLITKTNKYELIMGNLTARTIRL